MKVYVLEEFFVWESGSRILAIYDNKAMANKKRDELEFKEDDDSVRFIVYIKELNKDPV